MAQSKIKFIVNTSVEYFNVHGLFSDTTLEGQQPLIREFLDNPETTVICALWDKGHNTIQFHQRIPNTEEECLLFYKIPQINKPSAASIKLSPETTQLGLLTLEGGFIKSIYNSVSRVFSPHAAIQKSECGPEVTNLLENLHSSLGLTLGLPQTGIGNLKDEINYWQQKLQKKLNSRLERDAAQAFIETLSRVEEKLQTILESTNRPGGSLLDEFLDIVHQGLDELWRLPFQYPQARMSHLMDVMGEYIMEITVDPLLADDVWNVNNVPVNDLVNQAIDIAESWIQLCDSLTRLFWPNYVKHPWKGESHVPKNLLLLRDRLKDIQQLRNLHKQIVILLANEHIEEVNHCFLEAFKNIYIFDTSSGGQRKWSRCLQQLEQLLEPTDERIANALKVILSQHLSNPRQVVFLFGKYEALIRRNAVLESLTVEREQFIQSLHILLRDLRKAMTSDINSEPDTGNLSVICNECRWLKIIQHQILKIDKIRHLFTGREGFEDIIRALEELREETESLLRTNFEIWCNQSASEVKSGGKLRLEANEPVVKFEKEGRQLMRVTYNYKLVTFCQDVKEFENMGYTIPKELRDVAILAGKYMGYARRLQQISTFHNTIGDRIVPCQRPILLQDAMELSKLVRSETVAWNDEVLVEKFVNTLQKAVSKLSANNNLLIGYHEKANRIVLKLKDTDLITRMQVWKEEMRHLRELITSLEEQGFGNLDAFKLHWDQQLYRALEVQYIAGLVDMNNKLPDLHVKIMFRKRELCFLPTETEIREKYLKQLQRFVERPSTFCGLSERSGELFKGMVEKNSSYFGPLYAKTEELFAKLATFKESWQPWFALGRLDIDELCNTQLQTAHDWERNFRECKQFSQKIAKIQNTEESIDCIVIDILPLRSDLEAISRRYWEALASSLKQSILNNIADLDEFLRDSVKFLENVQLSNEESITESSVRYEQITNELVENTKTLEMTKSKEACLAGWTKERVPSLQNLLKQWERLQPLLGNHASVLQKQMDFLREQTNTKMHKFTEETEKFLLGWQSTLADLELNDAGASLQAFKERLNTWTKIKQKHNKLLEECEKFNMAIPAEAQQTFHDIDKRIAEDSKTWLLYDEYLKDLDLLMDEEWSVCSRRPYLITDFFGRWESSVQSSIDVSSQRIRQHVEQLQQCLPVLQILYSECLTERHWSAILMILENNSTKPLHRIKVKDVLSKPKLLLIKSEEIGKIVQQAGAEQVIRQAIVELDQWAVTAYFKLVEHKDGQGKSLTLIKDYQEVLNKIGDNQSLLQSAKSSTGVLEAMEAFADQAALWENKLNSAETVLTTLNQAQRRWIYLEPVFSADTLGRDDGVFKRVDRDFRYIMQQIEQDSRVISVIKIPNIEALSRTLEAQLVRCQTNLISFIMEKRDSFPRFYFLNNDDLLELLGQASKNTVVIQKHIKKLIPGCHELGVDIESSPFIIKSLYTAEGDVLKLRQSIEMTGPIEVWLSNLITSIQSTLRNDVEQCHAAASFFYNDGNSHLASRNDGNVSNVGNVGNVGNMGFQQSILEQYMTQVLCLVRAIRFTKDTERAIKSMSLKSLQQSLDGEIRQYTEWRHQTNDNLLKVKTGALLVDLVHYRTIVEQLIEYNVVDLHDWHWFSQLRYYLIKRESSKLSTSINVVIRIIYAEFEYSYEFLGNPNRLVNTTLTHRTYLILTQAMHMGLGGNPFGPAGTGKTECVKALGVLLGRLVLVFNCDENVDVDAMALILTGLVRCGAWGCFDEFNRLQEATLSAISMLIQPIQTALSQKLSSVQILDKNIQLNHHCGIFVTLNPAGADYGGRQKLPGNIQALFRPVIMQQPEPREIARVLLFVVGFHMASEIAERMVSLFEMCSKILTQQRHYDWGLRELKTVLITCGEIFQRKLLNSPSPSRSLETVTSASVPSGRDRSDDEFELQMAAVCLHRSIVPRLAAIDVCRFEMLMDTVFPEVNMTGSSFHKHKLFEQPESTIEHHLTEAFQILGLCFDSKQLQKAIQLHEQLQKHMGVVVMGEPGCGKSTIISLLQQAWTLSTSDSNAPLRLLRRHHIAPKSMSREQLLGHLDGDTRQWHDGVLTYIAATANSEPSDVHTWIVCDGSIDPDWIEALNSVLDDNRLLTLPSGWRIQFGANVNFIFETDNLQNASPATISRMGIVNMSLEDYPFELILKKQISQFEFPELIQNYMDELYEPLISKILKNNLSNVPALNRIVMIRALILRLLQRTNLQSRTEFAWNAFQTSLNFLTVQEEQVRKEFVQWFLFEKVKIQATPATNIILEHRQRPELIHYNPEADVCDVYDNKIEDSNELGLVKTGIVRRNLAMIDDFLNCGQSTPFLLLGPSGAAKTLLLQQAVLQHPGYTMLTINCSKQITPRYLMAALRKSCLMVNGVRGREYRPRQTRIILCLKNLDRCHRDAWNCSEIAEFLLQLVQHRGFYKGTDDSNIIVNRGQNQHQPEKRVQSNLTNSATNTLVEWININGLQVCATISALTREDAYASLSKITPRYLAINQLLYIGQLVNEEDLLPVTQLKLETLLLSSKGAHESKDNDSDSNSNSNWRKSRLQMAHFNGYSSQTLQSITKGLMEFYTKLEENFMCCENVVTNHSLENMKSSSLGKCPSSSVGSSFSVTGDSHRNVHYKFTMKLLMQALDNLVYYPPDAFYEALHCELVSSFRDRLCNTNDTDKFDHILRQTLRKTTNKEKVYFVPNTNINILQMLQHDEWLLTVQKHIQINNTESFAMDEIITENLLEQTEKIARLLNRNRAHLVIIGRPGNRQFESIYIAASMQQAKVHILRGDSTYRLANFQADLRMAIQTATSDNQSVWLVVEHSWISFQPEILRPIEAILNESEILGFFAEEMENLTSTLRQSAQMEDYQDSLESYFMKRLNKNFHLILCLDATNSNVQDYFEKYLALCSKTYMLYTRTDSLDEHFTLSREYLQMLNEFRLKAIVVTPSQHNTNNDKSINKQIPICEQFNEIVQQIFDQEAPLRFYKMIKSYFHIYIKLSHEIQQRLQKLQNGVGKLANARKVVDSLKTNAVKQEAELAEKRRLANGALEMISNTMRNANEQKSNMLELKKETQINSEKLKERQKEIALELAEVEPILNEASNAVGQIKAESLSEIRSLRAPPETIRDILEGVLRLMGVRDTSWNSMKTFLAKRGVKEDIRSLDPSRISIENCEAVEKLLKSKANSFNIKNAKRASAAAAPLAAWVQAMVRYVKVIQSIEPLEKEQNKLKHNLEQSENELQSLVMGLDDVDNQVKQLSSKLNEHTQEAALLEVKLAEARTTLNESEILVQQLSSEYEMWSSQVASLKETFNTLDLKALIIALMINYYTHVPSEIRRNYLDDIVKITNVKPKTEIIPSIWNDLVSNQKQIIWESMGLARGTQMMENAALLQQVISLPYDSCGVPLLIDPMETIQMWLENYLTLNEISHEVISQHNSRFVYTLELAVRFGKTLLVQDCEELKPPLLQIISNKFYMRFNKKQLEVATKLIDLHEQFQLILITKSHKLLNLPAEIRGYVICLPFTVTTSDLSDQLLSRFIQIKSPNLEAKRVELLKKDSVLLKTRQELEDKLLQELSLAQGDILKNTTLLKTLNEIKESSNLTEKALYESANVKSSLLIHCKPLQGLCAKCAQFYMDLIKSYDLISFIFIELFAKVLELYEVNINDKNSLNAFNDKFYKHLVRDTFQYLARTVRRNHHLTLGLFICHIAFKDKISVPEWELFVTNFMAISDINRRHSKTPTNQKYSEKIEIFGTEVSYKLQALLACKPELANLFQAENTITNWRQFMIGKISQPPPNNLGSFQQLLLIQILRPDLLTHYMNQTVEEILGISIESIQQPTVEQLASEADCEKPIVVITDQEIDPSLEICATALKQGDDNGKYQQLSIGKELENRSLNVIRHCAEEGKWLCIKNIHLVPNWLKDIHQYLQDVNKSSNFRLWLICESTKNTNAIALHKCVRVLYEYPIGIKQKITRMLQIYANSKEILKEDGKLIKIRILLFVVMAILQERRRFIPLGWSQFYEFTEADLTSALQIVHWLDSTILRNRNDWKTLQELLKSVAFGGRLNDGGRDLRILQIYLQEFINSNIFHQNWNPLNNVMMIKIPTSTQWNDYLNAFAKLPTRDRPEFFGFAKKSKDFCCLEDGEHILKELSLSYFNLAEDQSDLKLEKQVKSILTFWRKLATNLSIQKLTMELEAQPNSAESPWLLFLHMELKLTVRLYELIHSTLRRIHYILKDIANGVTPTLENRGLLNLLASNNVPEDWQLLWSGPLKTIDYLKSFAVRAQASVNRYRISWSSEKPEDFIDEIDLTTVFNGSSLLITFGLISSKWLKTPLKDLVLKSTLRKESSINSKTNERYESQNIDGQQMQLQLKSIKVSGGSFERGLLSIDGFSADTSANSIDFYVNYVKRSEIKKKVSVTEESSTATLPLYNNERREHLLCELELPTKESKQAILLSGVALIVTDL